MKDEIVVKFWEKGGCCDGSLEHFEGHLMQHLKKLGKPVIMDFLVAMNKALKGGGGVTLDTRNGFVRYDPPGGVPETRGHA